MGALFLGIGLLLLGWQKDIPGLLAILMAASLIWVGESSYQEFQRDRRRR